MEAIEKLKEKFKKTENFLKEEYSALRAGRATPALVENVFVDYYGTKVPLKQIASISAPESRLLIIEPWDKGALGAIEKSLLASNLGLSPIVDKNLIRISIPPLTEERRSALVKIIGVKLEEAKIKCRAARDEAMKEISDSFENKKITEDEKFKNREKVQELMNAAAAELENAAKFKEKEIKEG